MERGEGASLWCAFEAGGTHTSVRGLSQVEKDLSDFFFQNLVTEGESAQLLSFGPHCEIFVQFVAAKTKKADRVLWKISEDLSSYLQLSSRRYNQYKLCRLFEIPLMTH